MPFRFPCLAALLLAVAGCSEPPMAPAAAPVRAHPNCLAALPATPLVAPAAALYTQEFAATPLDAAGLHCLGQVLGDTRFASPQAHDGAYVRIQASHGEDQELRWPELPRERVQLLRIAQGTAATTWLLRIDTGLAMEGSRYDLLFTSDAQGQLRDQMLVGVEGAQYRRTVDLRSPAQFTVLEQGGREEQAGPDYAAAFRIDDSGRLSPDPGGVVAPLDAATVNSAAADSDSATSVETVDGAPGDIESVRRLLFSDSGVLEETVQKHSLADGSLAMLAVGRIDAAGLVLYVLRPAHEQPAAGRTQYLVASLSFAEPARALGGELGNIGWKADKDAVAIVLPVRYEFLREGGNADAGATETRSSDQELRARLDLVSGELRSSD